ncbi:GpE family phage tail protein [Brachymonas chironomi]|uniref:GpE family phage tail protein n=1 Tax=Brachymonas chironomi TaxID=491919 RepID=UPI00096E91EE
MRVSEEDYWQAAGLLARWFRFSPADIDGLEVGELVRWVKQACEQIRDQASVQSAA